MATVRALNLIEELTSDEKVRLAMAEEWGYDHTHVLFPLLEALCAVDATSLRQKAVESLCKIADQMKELDFFVEGFISLFKRLAATEIPSTRVSACLLFHAAYPNASEELKGELRLAYCRLCQDDVATVRKAAFTNLGNFADVVEPAHLRTDIMFMFQGQDDDEMGSSNLITRREIHDNRGLKILGKDKKEAKLRFLWKWRWGRRRL